MLPDSCEAIEASEASEDSEDMAGTAGLMKCEACHTDVLYGSDYVNHLNVVHNIKKGHVGYLHRARDNQNLNKKIEEIVLDSDDEETDVKELKNSKNFLEVERIFKKANEYLESERRHRDVVVTQEEIQACRTEELTRTFANIRKFVEDQRATREPPTPSNKSDVGQSPPTGPRPAPGETLYLCPLQQCKFYTNKAGMLSGEAARHLCIHHQVRPADMRPGAFKFTKLKGEKIK